MRFIGAQFEALLSNDLWKENAAHSNAMAKLLESRLRDIPKIKITQIVDANSIFALFPKKLLMKCRMNISFMFGMTAPMKCD
jgi:threonine aldolase